MVILLLQQEKQSSSYWEPENAEYLHQRSLHSEKLFDGVSHLLLSMALTSLKPAILQQLLGNSSTISMFYVTSVNQS